MAEPEMQSEAGPQLGSCWGNADKASRKESRGEPHPWEVL